MELWKTSCQVVGAWVITYHGLGFAIQLCERLYRHFRPLPPPKSYDEIYAEVARESKDRQDRQERIHAEAVEEFTALRGP